MITGARAGQMTGLRRLVAAAMARDLCAFVVPGPDVARARGLDFAALGLHLAATPRHANLLLIIGPMPALLVDSIAVIYAQMPRPRAILALDAGDIAPLPAADASAALSQQGLATALGDLRRIIAAGAFADGAADFEAAALATRIEYTCPMHPEVISDQPGNCPKCGMTLIPKETSSAGHAGHTQPEKEPAMPDKTPATTMANTHDHSKHAAAASEQYTCPMHPEVVSDEPGSCPKCGMFLVKVEEKKDAGHDHGGHDAHAGHAMQGGAVDGVEAHFMSMVDLTRDMPASPDGLKMEWITVPFGPFFPGLPGGLGLELTLDGDTVVQAHAHSLVGSGAAMADMPDTDTLAEKLAALSPLSPVAMRELVCRALEAATGRTPQDATARAAAIERERITSHLGWLASFAAQTGLVWLERRAAALQLALRGASAKALEQKAGALRAALHRIRATPLMRAKLAGIARVDSDLAAHGPVARASGQAIDARLDDPVYAALGFRVITQSGGDALARLYQRCDEIAQSLDLISRAGMILLPQTGDCAGLSGHGMALVETPRGAASLHLTLTDGKVSAARIETPFAAQIGLIDGLTAQAELADALVGVGSLDLDPWELHA